MTSSRAYLGTGCSTTHSGKLDQFLGLSRDRALRNTLRETRPVLGPIWVRGAPQRTQGNSTSSRAYLGTGCSTAHSGKLDQFLGLASTMRSTTHSGKLDQFWGLSRHRALHNTLRETRPVLGPVYSTSSGAYLGTGRSLTGNYHFEGLPR